MKIKKTSILKKFLFFVVLTPMLLVIISILSGFISFYLLDKIKEKILPQYAELIEGVIKDDYLTTQNAIELLEEKFKEKDNLSPLEIRDIVNDINEFTDINYDRTLPNSINFVSKDLSYLIAPNQGIIIKPFYLPSNMESVFNKLQNEKENFYVYINHSNNHLHHNYIIVSKITYKNGDIAGYVYSETDLQKLVSNLENKLKLDEVNFVVLDENFNLLVSSNKIELKERSQDYLFEKISDQLLSSNKGFFNSHVNYISNNLCYFQKIANLNFYLMIGTKKGVMFEDFKKIIIPEIFESSLIAITLFILFITFRNKILKPVVIIANKAKNISEGKFETLNLQSDIAEIEYLSQAINQIKEKVRTEIEIRFQLQSANEEIKKQSEQIKSAVEVKQKFLNNMSHELKTPLHAIIGMSECLSEHWGSLSEENKKQLSYEIFQNSERLNNLISNLLDFSKFEAGKMKFDFKMNDLVEMTETVVAECNSLIKQKGLLVEIKVEEDFDRFIMCDQEKVMQVIRNLLSNSVRYSNEGTILIHIFADSILYGTDLIRSICFSVEDQGIGINQEELKEIFVPFNQSSKTRSRAGGTGLGLSICLEIILAHKGKIWAENSETNMGSIFTFTIPYEN